MAQPDLPTVLMPSLKDRLLDPDSIGTRERPGYTLREVIESVREDLEELLNTRRSHKGPGAAYTELENSILTYGLPDVTATDSDSEARLEDIGKVLQKVIAQHEPRLRNVRATMIRKRGFGLRALFNIDAELRLDPAPPVAFETIVELTTGHATIRERTA